MATRPAIRIRHSPVRSYRNFQSNYPGAQSVPYRRGWWSQIDGADSSVVLGFATATLGPYLFVTGGFTTVGGKPRAGFAALDIATGLVVDDGSWTKTFLPAGNMCVGTDGAYLYVGGAFSDVDGVTAIAGKPIRGLVRFDINGTLDTAWNPEPNITAEIVQIEYNRDRGTVYVAGVSLNTMNVSTAPVTRNFVAEVDATPGSAGTATTWNPNPDAAVTCSRYDADRGFVYLAGAFTLIGATARNRLARVAAGATATLDSWNPNADNTVRDLILDGDVVRIGGNFLNVGTTPTARNRVAALDQLGATTQWNPNASAQVNRLIQYRGIVFIAGDFVTMSGTGRNRLAAVTTIGASSLTDWNPDADARVVSMVLSERTLYVAGTFATIVRTGGAAANPRIAAIRFPIFTDANTKYVAKTGSDAAAGTFAAPYLTIQNAINNLAGAFTYVAVKDSGVYDELVSIAYASTGPGGLFAIDGAAPTVQYTPGAVPGTYGARVSGRTIFSAGAPGTFIYVSKNGNNGTGVRGNPSLPFLTILGALGAAGRAAGDTIEIQDSGVYTDMANTIGALSVTIQAAAGTVPTIRRSVVSGSVVLANAGVNVSLYGLTFDNPANSIGQPTVGVTGILDVYDCTFAGDSRTITYSPTGTTTATIVGCSFRQNQRVAVYADGTSNVVIRNCYFTGCNEGTVVSEDAVVKILSNANRAVSITECTFLNSGGSPAGLQATIRFAPAGGVGGGVWGASKCYLADTTQSPDVVIGFHLQKVAGAVATAAMVISDIIGDGLGGPLVFETNDNAGGVPDRTYRSCVAYRCCRSTNGVVGNAASFWCASLAFPPGGAPFRTIRFEDCVSIQSGKDAFQVTTINAAGVATIQFVRCVAMNAGAVTTGSGYAITLGVSTQPTATATGCAEKGSSSGISFNRGSASGLVTANNCVFGSPLGGSALNPPGTRLLVSTDPLAVSSVSGNEDVAWLPDSPCLLAYTDRGNVGPWNSIVYVASNAGPIFTIDGLILSGPPNHRGGIGTASAQTFPTDVSYCSFLGLGPYGCQIAGSGEINNILASTSGPGAIVYEPAAQIVRSVAQSCGSVGFAVGGPANKVRHVTAFGCGAGEQEYPAASGIASSDNVLSGNTTDYQGSDGQDHSVVGSVEGIGPLTNGTRLDPLFRDVDTPDLLLQSVATGQFFDSPAIGLASDGGDAGAFSMFYGPVVLTWSVLDFGINPTNTDTAYRNPMHYTRRVVPYKPSEGDTHGGLFYSTASAFKTEHVLEWDQNAMMPVAQVSDLIALFTTGNGETQLSLDGGTTWIPCRIVRSSEFQYTELEGAMYGSDTLPTPVTRLVLRASD